MIKTATPYNVILLVGIIAVFFMPFYVKADSVSSQLLNDSQISRPSALDTLYIASDIGNLPVGTSFNGLQVWFNTDSFTDSGDICISSWVSEIAFKTHQSALADNCGSVNFATSSNGLVNILLDTTFTVASSTTYYAIQFQFFGYDYFTPPPTPPSSILFSELATGHTMFFDFYNGVSHSTSTKNNASFYYQIYLDTPTQYFTPNPFFQGFSTSSISSFCEPPSNILDVGGGVRYGLCTAFSFLFIPSSVSISQFNSLGTSITTKFPFSFAYAIINGFSSSAVASSSFLDIGFYADQISTSTIVDLPHVFVGLSTSTISQYYPDSIRLTARTLIEYVVWFSFAMFIFRSIFGFISPEKKE